MYVRDPNCPILPSPAPHYHVTPDKLRMLRLWFDNPDNQANPDEVRVYFWNDDKKDYETLVYRRVVEIGT